MNRRRAQALVPPPLAATPRPVLGGSGLGGSGLGGPGLAPPPAPAAGAGGHARRVRFRAGDSSVIGRWWNSVDHLMLVLIAVLVVIGVVLMLAAGPPAAQRIHADTFHFVRRQMVFTPVGVVLMLGVSLLSPRGVRRLAVIGFALMLGLLALTPLIAPEINGATRWLIVFGLTVQPSEILKPLFAVTVAWLLAGGLETEEVPGTVISLVLVAIVAGLLLSQPDVGMTLVIVAIWCAEVFMAGLPLVWVGVIGALGLGGVVGAYFLFPHVAYRVDRFLDPSSGDTYQIIQSMKAFAEGGLFGRGPGEGRVKEFLPDAHTDFIFAVAGEEFGLWLCLLVVALFAVLIVRALTRAIGSRDLFIMLAVGGLSVQLAMQTIINMASSLHLMPTKGMTLPFLSYGGSSMVGVALATGMILALTRRRGRTEERP
ncbi:cell division protein FtsW [Roseospira marina]|uniref:Probable peptidoglycan glycosyltransferase FtsW n=1 Tax=Roseospira marina TaxID=140057 RepID=A0A5M6I8V7_9PROT|nr:putative peptidoglycan glycosyltransferase FtsW [Roseospira marina]KAA5604572.1 cell division protein FtsW [Roseospira marina]MBB4315321.1 cell division protein FtsW [Roseospira marina]MBB5088320.1 cell division protein FtsW [Roseospira marina]